MPWWVYLVVAGIVFSAYMTIRTSREGYERERREAEENGRIYMERIKEEKEKRKLFSS